MLPVSKDPDAQTGGSATDTLLERREYSDGPRYVPVTAVSPGVSYFVQRKDETGREYYLNSTPQHLQSNPDGPSYLQTNRSSAVPVRPFCYSNNYYGILVEILDLFCDSVFVVIFVCTINNVVKLELWASWWFI
jgi:hypothetical protein